MPTMRTQRNASEKHSSPIFSSLLAPNSTLPNAEPDLNVWRSKIKAIFAKIAPRTRLIIVRKTQLYFL